MSRRSRAPVTGRADLAPRPSPAVSSPARACDGCGEDAVYRVVIALWGDVGVDHEADACWACACTEEDLGNLTRAVRL